MDSSPLPSKSNVTGQIQEEKALIFFKKMGWKLLSRNYRSPTGEIDLIFRDKKNFIVFVEVRYRQSLQFGPAQSTVTPAKQKRIVKTAYCYLKQNKLTHSDFRFDVAAISPDGVDHIPDAFRMSGFTL